MSDNPDMAKAVRLAVWDPGAILPRGDDYTEPVASWQARAVLEAVRRFIAAPAVLDDSDRPHVEEARRILTAFGEGYLPVPVSYGTERALYDAGRTLLDLVDKIAPKGEADA